MTVTVVVGGFFGDEGKGKIISYLSLKDDADIVARGGVGPNAGHTVVYKGRTYKLRQVPSGFVNPRARLLIGPGVLINPEVLLREIEETGTRDRIGIDANAGIIEKKHVNEDKGSEHLRGKIGSTGTGCGPAQRDRAMRILKVAKDVEELSPYITDVPMEVNDVIDRGGRVIIEGTQGTFLSLYHGTYPYVTSKDVTASSICADIGVGPKKIDDVMIVFKAYVTRVGKGPLEGELSPGEAKKRGWLEIATVTRRVRRAAPFNFKLARRAVMLNSATQVAITKIDILFPSDRSKKEWDKLSKEARSFIMKVEEELGIPVVLIGTGPEVDDIIDRRDQVSPK